MVKDLTKKQKTETKETKKKSVKARVKNKVQFFFQKKFLNKIFIWITFRWHVPHDDDDDDIDGKKKKQRCWWWLYGLIIFFQCSIWDSKTKNKMFPVLHVLWIKKERKEETFNKSDDEDFQKKIRLKYFDFEEEFKQNLKVWFCLLPVYFRNAKLFVFCNHRKNN